MTGKNKKGQLLAGDIIYNKILKKHFQIVRPRVVWSRDHIIDPDANKKYSNCDYRKWEYDIQPVGEVWWNEYESSFKGGSRLLRMYNMANENIMNSEYSMLRYTSSDGNLATVGLTSIPPGCFELWGFRLLTKKEKRTVRVLYGKKD